MNCPKCGFTQEERADCKKCGVVFSKFYALHSQEPASIYELQNPIQAPAGSGEGYQSSEPADLATVRQSLRDLQQRFNEIEFERAERRQIRSEIHVLDERLQEILGRIASRQEEIEQHIAELASFSANPSVRSFVDLAEKLRGFDVESMSRRLENLEDQLKSLAEDAQEKHESVTSDSLAALESRMKDIEGRVETLHESSNSSAIDNARAQIDGAHKGIEELKTALQNVTLRYSEIGEL